ncbi:Spo0E family sporulation regulatory protein-aspartic acid phosphatase [Clostridium sp. D2Q-14]|uniref:Spo0E family sporulation regulatory protein-aspartic acid phosphatase n=1 Tax=Anaeromonas gelatinilytica TaxID=2683194 RepID=UPI00193B7439|nr:Spo0E family sporulation regulatory protein-aspartic acid phosphatase [Anaeromonas gelatinilytica]MBS4536365.1 Spo0E family sporulation regulatory protein-aspartic acid phosphatase [Anaeromonas gelatinilytica]
MYKQNIFLNMNDKRNSLNALINNNSNNLTSLDIINASKELDKLIIVCQIKMNKKLNKVH